MLSFWHTAKQTSTIEKEIQSKETPDNISPEERKKEFFHRLEILNEFFEGREGWKKFDYEREMLTSFTPKVRAELITKNLSFDWSLFFKSAKSGDFKACEVIFFAFRVLQNFNKEIFTPTRVIQVSKISETMHFKRNPR